MGGEKSHSNLFNTKIRNKIATNASSLTNFHPVSSEIIMNSPKLPRGARLTHNLKYEN